MSLVRYCLAVFAFAAILLIACGGPTTPPTGDANTLRLVRRATVWADQDGKAQVVKACLANGPSDSDSQRVCIATTMGTLGAPPEAVQFFESTGYWLTGFREGRPLALGYVQAPAGVARGPEMVFLNGMPRLQLVSRLFEQMVPATPGDSPNSFAADPLYPALLAAEQRLNRGGDPVDLRLFDANAIENFTSLQLGGQRFIIQSGIHNFCADCGTGVGARFALEFDAVGRFAAVRLLGLCQGRFVIDDGGRVYHQFSGIRTKSGATGLTEPYLLAVPGLATCPDTFGV